MSNVYKGLGFLGKIDKVQIPDIVDKNIEKTQAADPNDEIELKVESDNNEEESKKDGTENPINLEISENESEETISEQEPELVPLTLEEIQEMYEEDLKKLTDEVAKQAYYDAVKEKKSELKKTITDVKQLMDELVENQTEFIEQYTKELKYMAVEIAQKMILEKIEEDDLILERLVLKTIKNVKNAEWLKVEVSERLVNLIDHLNEEMDKPEYNGKAYVMPVAGTDDICRVTSEDGTIVSTISTQAENLKKVFRDFESK